MSVLTTVVVCHRPSPPAHLAMVTMPMLSRGLATAGAAVLTRVHHNHPPMVEFKTLLGGNPGRFYGDVVELTSACSAPLPDLPQVGGIPPLANVWAALMILTSPDDVADGDNPSDLHALLVERLTDHLEHDGIPWSWTSDLRPTELRVDRATFLPWQSGTIAELPQLGDPFAWLEAHR